MIRPASWSCTLTCVVCGNQFVARSGASKRCDDCRAKPCPQCGKPVKQWNGNVCECCCSRNRYWDNHELLSVKGKQYYQLNKERIKAKSALYRTRYPEKIRAMTARYQSENHGEIMARAKLSELILRLETFDAYGGKCALCGEGSQEFLCLDHVGNNGKEERALVGGGRHLYRYLRKQGYPKNGYRVLCYNCNMARMLEEKMSIPQRPAQVRYTRKVKAEMVEAYGGKCVCCGESNPVLLALDHINGNGQSDRAMNGRGRVMYARLKKLGYPRDEYRLLCHNCNMSLGFFGYCPHGGLR